MPGSGRFGDGGAAVSPHSGRSRISIRRTFVGAAPVDPPLLDIALSHAPSLIAVDGGADAVLAAGRMPDAVVGDLDSLSDAARDAFADRLHPIAEQDSTDFAKALRNFPAALVIAIGFLGGRADHFLGVLTEMARTRAPVILLGQEECICIAPPACALDLAPGTRVSLWPLGPATGRSTGLRWPLDGLAFGPTSRTATSNEATGPVRLTLDGDMALLLPADALPAMIACARPAPRRADAPGL